MFTLILEEVSDIGGQKSSTGVNASGSGVVAKGSIGVILDKASEKALAKRWSTRWYPEAMKECSKILGNPTKKESTKSRKAQEKMLKNQTEIKQQNQVLLEKQEDIKALLLKSMEKVESNNHSVLVAKYPYGYSLFAIDHHNIIIPNDSIFSRDYDINWSVAKITSNTLDKITLRMPSFIRKDGRIVVDDNYVTIPKRLGTDVKFFCINKIRVEIEYLETTSDGIVALIGLAPC